MNILALDLGTKTGWALSAGGKITAGTWTLATPKEITEAKKTRMDRRCDPRFVRLMQHLTREVALNPLHWAVFEDVEFCKSRMQAHLWATWRAAVWMLPVYGINTDCLATGKLKSFATGSGAADKDMMARSLTLDPRYSLDKGVVYDNLMKVKLDDNAVDALHLLHWAMTTFK